MTPSGPGILRYLTKESDNYTVFITQLINIVIESAIDKYEKESCNLITLYRVSKLILSTTKIKLVFQDRKIHINYFNSLG